LKQPRARVLFRLPQPTNSPDEYLRIVQALLDKYSIADKQPKDAARLWYGSKDCEARIIGRTLNVDKLQSSLVITYEVRDQEEYVDFGKPIPERRRNDHAFHYALMFVKYKNPSLSKEMIVNLLVKNWESLGYPVPLEEIEEAVDSAIKRVRKKKKASQTITSPTIRDAYSQLGYKFQLNKLTWMVHVNGRQITDFDEAEIRDQLRDLWAQPAPLTHCHDVMLEMAAENEFNQVKEYIESEKWDGEDHIAKLTSFVTDLDGLFLTVLRRWLIGAVSRVYIPGSENFMMVLVGNQNLGKSVLAGFLADGLDKRYFVEDSIKPDKVDHAIRLMSTFIWEVKELESTTRRQDLDALKGFLTTMSVNERLPYGKNPVYAPAITSFVGTVNLNNMGFLSDPTGDRRYAVVELENIDWNYSKQINMRQVWAQAKALMENGETNTWTVDELGKVRTAKERFQRIPPSHDTLNEMMVFEYGSFVPTNVILAEMRNRGHGGNDLILQKDIADWMTRRIVEGKDVQATRQHVTTADGKKTMLHGWRGVKMIKIVMEEGWGSNFFSTKQVKQPVEKPQKTRSKTKTNAPK